jgi:hypothetical protein
VKTLLKLLIVGLIVKWVMDKVRERRALTETASTPTTTTGGTSTATTPA